jgi:hypothetical protein
VGVRLMPRVYWLLLVVLAGMSFLPMKVLIRVYREPNEILLTAKCYLWFIPISVSTRNPLTRVIHTLSENRFWKKEIPQDVKAKEISWKRLISRIKILNTVFLPVTRAANTFFYKISRPVRIKSLKLATELGLGDAAETAVVSGLVWSLKGTVLSMLSYYFNLEKTRPVIVVRPIYNNPYYLRIDYSCIFEFRLGHIIIVIYQLVRSFTEIRNLIRRVSQ